jgi:hypothetical protein
MAPSSTPAVDHPSLAETFAQRDHAAEYRVGGRMLWWVSGAVVGAALALWNATVTARVWRSGVYERGQLLAQTVIIWLVPGSAFGVAAVLTSAAPRRALDPTVSNPDTPHATITTGASGVGAP